MKLKTTVYFRIFTFLLVGILTSFSLSSKSFAFTGDVTLGGYLGSDYATMGDSLDVSHITFDFSPACSSLATGWRFELYNATQHFDIFNDDYSNGHFDCEGGIGSVTVTHGGTLSTDEISVAIYNSYGSDSYFSENVPLSSFVPPSETPTPTPTPTSTQVKIEASPSSGSKSVGTPFNVNVVVNSEDHAFNAARANVAVSSNLTITGIHNATSNACNLHYTKQPTTSSPSFAGAIYGSSSEGCNVYTLTLTPNETGTGTITFTNGSVKAYSDNSEIIDDVTDASFTIGTGPTPTPTSSPLDFAITSPLLTYKTNFNLTGTKESSITSIFVNGSDNDSTYPSSTTWQVPVTLALGDNAFTLYGSDGTNNTATQTTHVNRHTLGDINGDGNIDLIDASLFAVDWDKTEDLTYILSDMNDDGNVDLTDLSILAKLQE
jgi:hypothetical protein